MSNNMALEPIQEPLHEAEEIAHVCVAVEDFRMRLVWGSSYLG